MNRTNIDITGMGLVCCLGSGVDSVYRRMCAGECGIRPIDRFPSEPYPQQQGGQLPEDVEELLRDFYPEDDIAGAMVKAAGLEALAQAGCEVDGDADPDLGLVLATNFGPMETLEWCWRERVDVGTIDRDTFDGVDEFLPRLAHFFACGGPLLQLSLSCASGASALALARDLITSGRAKRVLAVGYDALTEYCWCGLTNLRTITTDRMRPFDVNRSGTIFSEGAAAMLVEGSGSGTSPALACLAGAATNNNAFHMTAPAKEADGSRRVMASAIADAGLTPGDIDHVCAHATSTKANDVTEAAALRNLFGNRLAELTVSAHKSQLGHLMGAAGLAEAIIAVQVIRKGIIPPTVNHETADPECVLDCIPGQARQRSVSCVVTNSAGLGGNNASVVLARAEDRLTQPTQTAEIAIAGAGWVLPMGVGSGNEIFRHADWASWPLGNEGALDGFSAKPYLSSVKGYLDPASAYCLAASALALGRAGGTEVSGLRENAGVCTLTRYGASLSAFRFFEQLVQKGPRFASPLVFPHGYASTAGNLCAIEFEFGGPHMVLFGAQDVREALAFAAMRLEHGDADEMLVSVYESADRRALPDDCVVMNGAITLRLTRSESGSGIRTFTSDTLWAGDVDGSGEFGAVGGMLRLLPGLGV